MPLLMSKRGLPSLVRLACLLIAFLDPDQLPSVEPNASNNLAVARQTGDTSYIASTAISVYYAQGRNEIAVGSYVLPIVQPLLGRILGQFNARSVAEYIAANSGNATALQLLSQAPQTLSQPIWYTMSNVRPYTAQVASAITLVGHIYVIIFAYVAPLVKLSAHILTAHLGSSSLCLALVLERSSGRISIPPL